jgi:hypothetical protein
MKDLKDGSNMITGVFDMDSISSPIGEYMLFLVMLLLEVNKDDYASFEIIVKSEKNSIDDNLRMFFKGFKCVIRYVEVANQSELSMQIDNKKPHFNLSEKEAWSYIKKVYLIRENIPTLRCKSEYIKSAKVILNKFSSEVPIVAVHLKNSMRSSGRRDWYSADLVEWLKFFEIAESSFKCHFILIGNESLPLEMKELSNVSITKEIGVDLMVDLAIIEVSHAFIGSTSGPAQMAIFGHSPYSIYKNPDHHVDLMNRVLGTSNCFIFANPLQNLYRRHEVCKGIVSDFEKIYRSIV